MNSETPMHVSTATLLGICIDNLPLNAAIEQAMAAIEGEHKEVTFACANPHSLVVAQDDTTFFNSLNSTDLVVADGAGIMFAGCLARIKVGPRIAGAKYFFSVMKALQARGKGRILFFGSSDYVLEHISKRMQEEFPALELCGTISPPFRGWNVDENQAMLEQINDARPDVLWVGMTAPKQEKWVHENRNSLHVPVIGSIGAVFDFYAGTHPRAPQWMCNAGMEWLYRLLREPRRMWKRNFVSTPKFLYLVLLEHILKTKRATRKRVGKS